jgi:hypothetical protein
MPTIFTEGSGAGLAASMLPVVVVAVTLSVCACALCIWVFVARRSKEEKEDEKDEKKSIQDDELSSINGVNCNYVMDGYATPNNEVAVPDVYITHVIENDMGAEAVDLLETKALRACFSEQWESPEVKELRGSFDDSDTTEGKAQEDMHEPRGTFVQPFIPHAAQELLRSTEQWESPEARDLRGASFRYDGKL